MLPLAIDADFPGGNIVVEQTTETTARVRQDLRDTTTDWFYWAFRLRDAQGRDVHITFTGSNPLAGRGPAVSDDAGATWRWLGAEAVNGQSFRYHVPDSPDVRFAMHIPYLQADWQAFVAGRSGRPGWVVETLCRSEHDRPVERLRLGRLDGTAPHRLLFTARHHCCEAMASYMLEGVVDGLLASPWCALNVEAMVVPFVDKDGVEQGDQGKNRRPRDHNRDYDERARYAAVKSLMAEVPAWSAGRLRLALDLHCPWIRGEWNEHPYFVGGPEQDNWRRALALAAQLEGTDHGPLPYSAARNLPYGTAWNTDANTTDGRSFARWAASLSDTVTATALEFPYAVVDGQEVTPDKARAFGRGLARAIERWLQR
ncbi:MAG: peptidase M14 [Armatimonadetes bacterium]|nr:peptidase M14 [Armatimonadota bacterium]